MAGYETYFAIVLAIAVVVVTQTITNFINKKKEEWSE